MDRTITALDDVRDVRRRKMFCLPDLSEHDVPLAWLTDGQ